MLRNDFHLHELFAARTRSRLSRHAGRRQLPMVRPYLEIRMLSKMLQKMQSCWRPGGDVIVVPAFRLCFMEPTWQVPDSPCLMNGEETAASDDHYSFFLCMSRSCQPRRSPKRTMIVPARREGSQSSPKRSRFERQMLA